MKCSPNVKSALESSDNAYKINTVRVASGCFDAQVRKMREKFGKEKERKLFFYLSLTSPLFIMSGEKRVLLV